MSSPQLFKVGDKVRTDTGRQATVLKVSRAFNAALIQFANGHSDWWALSTLELTTDAGAAA